MVSNVFDYLWLVLAFPLLGVVLNGLLAIFAERPILLAEALAHGHGGHGGHDDHGHGGGHHETPAYRKLVAFIAPAVIFGAFVVALLAVVELASLPPESRTVVRQLFPWINSGSLQVPVALQLDPLSSVMVLVVTGVGFLIHVYSTGYMSHDAAYARFFVYLNLFMFSMLTLVLASNYLLMFVGWEGVGLCSYLLIGYYYEKKSAADAGKKAFVANRVGDFGFLLAMFLIFWNFGSLNYVDVFAKVPGMVQAGTLTTAIATTITLCMFLGATGKSAQIPLYVWLPDAMEGPTPVSALIHAATMVTAGVYMVARSNILFLLSPTAMATVATIGALTAIFAATIGICQTDIKRVLAYSTVSQLGYMFLACGVGAFTAGIFHLMTHAFFKALLFLGSGSVIHVLSGEQDMRKMGNVKKYAPITFATMALATVAIAGIPPFAGFFSKDEILWKAFSDPTHGNKFLWVLAACAAGITAFYMFRLIYMTFFGESRMDKHVEEHAHESPYSMTVPLMVLAVLSVCGGWIGVPAALGGANHFEHWLHPVFAQGQALVAAGGAAAHGVAAVAGHGAVEAAGAAASAAGHGAMEAATTAASVAGHGAPEAAGHAAAAGAHGGGHNVALEYGLMALSVAIALVGITIASLFYYRRSEAPAKIAASFPGLYKAVYNKYYVDEIYEAAIIRRIVDLSNFLWVNFDAAVIDGTVNGVAKVTRSVGDGIRRVQTGLVGNYAFAVLSGAVCVVAYLLFR
jgi:NADH-quinone oxidoreductase subunit L